MTINKIISKTLLHFKESKELMTPENFAKAFCDVAKKENLKFDECDKVANYRQRLAPSIQKVMQGYSVKSVDDLLYFLTMQLNRMEKADNKVLSIAQEKLLKTLLKTVQHLHSKEAEKLAETTLNGDLKLVNFLNSSQEKFRTFNDTYSHAFLNELDRLGNFTKEDLPTLIGELVRELESKEELHTADDLVRLLIVALTPSISTSVSDTVAKLEEQLKTSPELITSKAMKEEITQCIIQRIKDDNEIFNAKIRDANRVIDSLLEKIAAMIASSEEKCEDVVQIKEELQAIDFSANAQTVQGQLIDISTKIDRSIKDFSRSLNEDQSEIQVLKTKILALEKELAQAQKEASEDYLTSTLTRRGLAKKMEEFEAAYGQSGTDYAVVFFDIDHFKSINDRYGHNAGDIILASIGKFLKKHTDTGDTVGRYGGEEFVLLTHKKDPTTIYRFVEALRKKVEKTKFVYRKKEITVTCSAGIALRSEYESRQACIKQADAYVYEAKHAGRNQVFPKP